MKRALILLAIISLVGCAWSHYENQAMKCWTIVIGQGKLGADCGKTKAMLASEDTGFSDNAAPVVEALGIAIGKGFAAAAGTEGASALAEGIGARLDDEEDGP